MKDKTILRKLAIIFAVPTAIGAIIGCCFHPMIGFTILITGVLSYLVIVALLYILAWLFKSE